MNSFSVSMYESLNKKITFPCACMHVPVVASVSLEERIGTSEAGARVTQLPDT